ncbi:hypothetical protein MTR_8g099270 [Medicago truncatula]|uniref:Uncharacterized protein n=1 Tax=Medicago truncatula TaxID=3880 RepID=A0A072TWD4_MEDTR|nr:hypothetical protein MTR_8g099270 [Medicago truncatula]
MTLLTHLTLATTQTSEYSWRKEFFSLHALSKMIRHIQRGYQKISPGYFWMKIIGILVFAQDEHRPMLQKAQPRFLRWYQSLFKIHWATCYQVSAIEPPTIYVHEPSPRVLVVRGCVKSPNVGISGGNPHLTSRICGGCLTEIKLIYNYEVLVEDLKKLFGFSFWIRSDQLNLLEIQITHVAAILLLELNRFRKEDIRKT